MPSNHNTNYEMLITLRMARATYTKLEFIAKYLKFENVENLLLEMVILGLDEVKARMLSPAPVNFTESQQEARTRILLLLGAHLKEKLGRRLPNRTMNLRESIHFAVVITPELSD